MKIKYEFADGTISEVEVDEELGAYITALNREESNAERRVRYHCPISLDSLEFEGDIFADDTYSSDKPFDVNESEKRMEEFLMALTKTQRERLIKLMEGKSLREIAREEGVHHKSIEETISAIRKKYEKFKK